jgi:hypothetical protein
MSKPRVPIGLPIAAAILFILGFFVAGPVIESLASEEQMASNVLLSAIPFILVFVGIILTYITIIWLVASSLNNNISPGVYRVIELILIGGIIVGALFMFQPWSMALFKPGFLILLFSTLSFILWSHVTPKGKLRHEEMGSVSVTEIEGGD